MRLPISLLVLAAVSQTALTLTAATKTTDDNKSSKRELAEGNYGMKNGVFLKFVPPGAPSEASALDFREEYSQQPAQEVFGTRVPQYAKISDVLSGQGPFEVAVANQLYSPVSVYQPKVKPFKVSMRISSHLDFSEHNTYKQSQNSSKEHYEQTIQRVPKEEPAQFRFDFKNTLPDDPQHDTKLDHLETAYPRLELRYAPPKVSFVPGVFVQQPQFQKQPEPQLGFHHPKQLPLRYSYGNLKPIQFVRQQSYLLPKQPKENYIRQQETEDKNEDEQEDNMGKLVSGDYEGHSTAKPITLQSVTRKPNQFHNIHPHGAVSHASFYQGPFRRSQLRQYLPPLPEEFSPVSPKSYIQNQRYMPVTQSPIKYSTVSPQSLSPVPIQYKLVQIQPSLQSQQLVAIRQPSIQIRQQPQGELESIHRSGIQYQQQNEQYQQQIDQYEQDEQLQQQNVQYPEIQQQDNQYESLKQTEIESQNIAEFQPATVLEKQPSQSIVKQLQVQQTLSPIEQTLYTENPEKKPIFLSNNLAFTFKPVTEVSTTPIPIIRTENPPTTIISHTLKSQRYLPPSKAARIFKPFSRPRPFNTRSTELPSPSTTPFSTFRRHVITKLHSTTPSTEVSSPASKPKSVEILSTLPESTTPRFYQEFSQNHIESTTAQPLSSTADFNSIEISSPAAYPVPERASPLSFPTLDPTTFRQLTTPLPELQPEQIVSQSKSISQPSLEPQSILKTTASQPQQTLKSVPQMESVSHLQNIPQPVSQFHSIFPSILLPKQNKAIQTSLLSKHLRPDLPAQPQPGVIYHMQSQPPIPSEPLLQPPPIQVTPPPKYQPFTQAQYETHSSPPREYQTESPIPQISSTPQPSDEPPTNNLYLTYFPGSTPIPTLLLQPLSLAQPTLEPQSQYTLLAHPQLNIPEPNPQPIHNLPDQKKQKPSKSKVRPALKKEDALHVPDGAILTRVQPVFQPQIYSQPQQILFDPDFENAQLPTFSNVQYFGNYAEAIFGGFPQKKR